MSVDNTLTDIPKRSVENPPEDLHEALLRVFQPVIRELDECVENARNSQQDVKRQIGALEEVVLKLNQLDDPSPTLDAYAKKLSSMKRRVTVMFNILQNVQDRLKRMESTAPLPPSSEQTNSSQITAPQNS